MLTLTWRRLCVLAAIGQAVARPPHYSAPYAGNSSMPFSRLLPRQDDDFDPTDLSTFITNLAAIGDSYSAGIGAGDSLGSIAQAPFKQSDWACRRYDHSYPYLVYGDARFGDGYPNFQFLSCSGALTADVLEHQIPNLNGNQDAIMLSVGGNDVELTNILNQCIYQWAAFNWEQVTVAEITAEILNEEYEWDTDYDFEPLGRGCDGQLSHSADLIASKDFSNSLDAVVQKAMAKLAPGGKIYWTGYAKFFAEDLSSDCDSVTWSMWIHKLVNIWQPDQYLTSDHRRTMNSLVDQVNAQLAAAAARAGDSVIFVNYDKYVGQFGGRFCEAGVDESTTASNSRMGLMFYELNSDDWNGADPWKRSTDDPLNGTFEGDTNVFAQIVETIDPGVTFAQQDEIGNAASTQSSVSYLKANSTSYLEANSTSYLKTNSTSYLKTNFTKVNAADDDIGIEVPNLLPDGFGRVFHPQILLHQLIANMVLWEMMNVKEVNAGFPPLPQDLAADQSCPIVDVPTPDFYARILPLGASIMQGYTSTDGNGMRKHLRDALRQMKWDVNMVGSKNTGDMIDNNNEATPGDRVDQIQQKFKLSSKYQPNIVVINAGTNDATQYHDLDNFKARYNAMLDDIYDAILDVTVVVSTLLPGTTDGIPQNRDYINQQIRDIVSERRYNAAQRIVLTDVDVPAGYFTTADIHDGTHPTDDGYRKLAAFFLRGIEQAATERLIVAPSDTPYSDEPGAGQGDNTCDKVYGSGSSDGPVTTQQGSGLDDGIYSHGSTSKGVLWTLNATAGTNFTFARLSKPFGNHDLVIIDNYVVPADDAGDPTGRQYRVWPNNGAGWNSGKKENEDFWVIVMTDACIARGVRFVDVNADGLDDMVCVGADGHAYVSINQASYKFAAPHLWTESQGPVQERVLLADIDGDGRADYCTIADTGDIHCWRNGGQGDYPDYWQDLGVIFTGKGFGDLHGVRFTDLNGDGRDDWMWVDDTGKTWTYTNNRGCTKGTLEPLWREGTNSADQNTWTHVGLTDTVGRENIRFAKVYGQPEAFSLGGRADYIWIESIPDTSDRSYTTYKFHVWQNEGSGATKLKADGDRYCNMMGRANGAMDYVWVHSTGYMVLYESLGGKFPSQAPYWGSHYQIWSAADQVGHDIDRRDLHLADWDGDGLCDIIYVNPDGGAVDVWINQYKAQGDITKWNHISGIGTSCAEKRGVGIYDLAVRFADIDGDGRADYLCIEKDTRTTGFLNHASGLEDVGQIKYSIGKDRANIRWADVNGDGLPDLLWVDKFNGDASVWYNKGKIPASGSAFTWAGQGKLYEGAAQGSCIHYPDLDGNGRADMHVTDSLTNTAVTWFNLCPGEGSSDNGDDADTLTDTPVVPP